MDWHEYEDLICAELRSRYPDAQITRDARVEGQISAIPRQIDMLVEHLVLDSPVRTIVDAKHYSRRIDVKDVEEFLGMMADVGAHRGMMVTSVGYSDAALRRAHNERLDVELDVFSVAELKTFQGASAIPYSGSHGVCIDAPFGWVVDGHQGEPFPACLYPRGMDLREAIAAREWAYVNFSVRRPPVMTLEELVEQQNRGLRDMDPSVQISWHPAPIRADGFRTLIREALVEGYAAPEYTGFVEFEDFIFLMVVFAAPETAKRNLRKLREVLRSAFWMRIKHKADGERGADAAN